ncbi:MAG: GNAT family N-acetyltransferase [Pseudomonadota bacterium]
MATTQIDLREARPGDLGELRRMLRAAYDVGLKGYYAPETLARVIPTVAEGNLRLIMSGRFHVATSGDRIVGCGGWSDGPPTPVGRNALEVGRCAHLRQFATHPEVAGQGVGKALFQRCRDQAEAAGLDYFECQSTLMAEGFYAGLGFRHRRFIWTPIRGRQFALVVMRRPVSVETDRDRRTAI